MAQYLQRETYLRQLIQAMTEKFIYHSTTYLLELSCKTTTPALSLRYQEWPGIS